MPVQRVVQLGTLFRNTMPKTNTKTSSFLLFTYTVSGVFFTKNKAVTKIEDSGRSQRPWPTATVTKMLGMMGATPVGMPVPVFPEALSKGVIDGAVIPFEVAPGLKVHELTKFLSRTDKILLRCTPPCLLFL